MAYKRDRERVSNTKNSEETEINKAEAGRERAGSDEEK